MPLNIPDMEMLARVHRSDFQFVLRTWLTTVLLGSILVSFLMSAIVYSGPDFSSWTDDATFAAGISLVCSIPVLILFYIAVRIVNVQNLPALWKKVLLSLIAIGGIFASCLPLVDHFNLKTQMIVIGGYTLVLIAACFFFSLKPVQPAADTI